MEPQGMILNGVVIPPPLPPEEMAKRRAAIVGLIPKMKTLARQQERREARIEAQLAKPAPEPPAPKPPKEPRSRKKVLELIPVGTWIRSKARNSDAIYTEKIMGHIHGGEDIHEAAGRYGIKLPNRAAKTDISIRPRYILGSPQQDVFGAWLYRSTLAAEINGLLIEKLDQEPPHPTRTTSPIPSGVVLSWPSRSATKTVERNGVIRAYVPAGTPLSALGLAHIVCPSCGIVDSSERDRYAVQCGRQWLTPRAAILEAQFLPEKC